MEVADDEQPQKYSELFDPNEKSADGKTVGQIIALTLGAVNVAASMAPQGGEGFLACDKLIREYVPSTVRFGLDSAVGLSSGIGKFAIVYYYGRWGFMELGTLKGWEDIGNKVVSLIIPGNYGAAYKSLGL